MANALGIHLGTSAVLIYLTGGEALWPSMNTCMAKNMGLGHVSAAAPFFMGTVVIGKGFAEIQRCEI